MIVDIPRAIEFFSSFTSLVPGDVIATGTPGGVGFARQPPVWLVPGDIIEVTVEGVGTIPSRVVAEPGQADWRGGRSASRRRPLAQGRLRGTRGSGKNMITSLAARRRHMLGTHTINSTAAPADRAPAWPPARVGTVRPRRAGAAPAAAARAQRSPSPTSRRSPVPTRRSGRHISCPATRRPRRSTRRAACSAKTQLQVGWTPGATRPTPFPRSARCSPRRSLALVIGCTSDEAASVVPIIDANKMVMFCMTGQSEFDSVQFPYFFRLVPPDLVGVLRDGRHRAAVHYKKIALAFGNDIGSQTFIKPAIPAIKKAGITLTSDQTLDLSATTFRTEADAIVMSKPSDPHRGARVDRRRPFPRSSSSTAAR